MGKYISNFATTAEFNTVKDDLATPHVSLTRDNMDVHYIPFETRVVAKYNVTSTSSPTQIGYEQYTSGFSAIEIDGVEQSSVVSAYTFDTVGEHTVKYTLTDPTTIGNHAFYECSSLTSIDIPSGVTRIADYAFYECSSLTSIDIPSGVTSIGDSAFEYCRSLTSIDIPNSVRSIDSSAFSSCSGLTSCTIGSGVTSIGAYAFAYCSGLTSIDIPSGVRRIGDGAFSDCSSLTSITVDSSNTVYDSRNNCNAIIETNTNTLIQGCKNTVIPNSVTSIGNSAFYHCKSLTSITIPNSVTSIGNYAFYYCSSLTSITCNATTPPTLSSTSAFSNTNNCPIYVPSGSVNAYKAATNWSSFASRIQAIS